MFEQGLPTSTLHPRGGSGVSGAEKSEGICKAVEHGCGKGQAHLLCNGVVRLSWQGLCKVMAKVGGEGPEGLKSISESLFIGFQVNRALRIEHMMRPRLYERGERSRLG
jgi:hypothetical protein